MDWHEWQRAFMTEWYRLAEGCADMHQTADLAIEAYPNNQDRDPAQVAREEWGQPA